VTFLEKFLYEREAIASALRAAPIPSILFNKDSIPKELPCAILVLSGENGTRGTAKRFTDSDLLWTVFLIVNAQNVTDPDTELYTLKETFRAAYLNALGRDLPQIEYYTSRLDGARLVRIAKIDLLRSGTGAAS
jgi:hypothetical protein